jgi:hypothetical protein
MSDISQVNYLFALLIAFVTSWQVKTLLGLILIDLGFGVASALQRKKFEWGKLADFYQTNVMPYILGYLVLYVCVGFLIPSESLGGIGEPVSTAAVTLAWGTLVIKLVKSIQGNFGELYQKP